ncbi:hypothetical protein [Flavobacterium silvaticum]|uniref:Uncharacterized protein n=1 Tax=Flavobacterium silvaticum TaxID=1852020 RepID=A0A972FL05_9FLAO|nr:hypothetical protein [Flavobacterium silvaticum]NMH27678.1 hypothetical protein [Flavobacterium silvaticum]
MKHFFILLLIPVAMSAQRYDIISGKFENLKSIAAYNVTFDYKGMEINGYASEEAFIKEKVEKREKNPEKAERFAKQWYADREEKYEPRFMEYFNKRFDKGEVSVAKNPSATYTMKIKTVWIYPGYGIGPGGEPPKITAIVSVFETANPANVLLEVKFEKAIGLDNKNLNDPGERISGAYEKLAKNLVQQIKRIL